jgi:hypothetical protein
VNGGRRTVLEPEIEFRQSRDAAANAFLHESRAPGVDLRAGPVVDVAAEARLQVVTRRHPGHVPPGEGATHRPASCQRALR